MGGWIKLFWVREEQESPVWRCLDGAFSRLIDYFRRALLTLRRLFWTKQLTPNAELHAAPPLYSPFKVISLATTAASLFRRWVKTLNSSFLLHGHLFGIWTSKSWNVCVSVCPQRPCGYKVKLFGANTAIRRHSWRSSGNPWSDGGAPPQVCMATQSHKVCIYTHRTVDWHKRVHTCGSGERRTQHLSTVGVSQPS